MTKPDYQLMTKEQLTQYILAHRDDKDAIHEAALRIQRDGKEINSVDELRQAILEKQNN